MLGAGCQNVGPRGYYIIPLMHPDIVVPCSCDVPDPREGLVTALLYDLEVSNLARATHLLVS